VGTLIADAQYTDEEYEQKRGWGHSSISHVINLAAAAGAKRLALYHHEPTHDDKQLLAIEKKAKAQAKKRKKDLQLYMAREGQVADV
jgi:ribonuclease BN (tRNA processing enzyme)